MPNREKKAFNFYILCMVLGFCIMGCDQIKAFTEYFSKSPKSEKPVLSPKASDDQSQSVQAAQDKESFPADVLARVGNWSITIEEFQERLAALKEVVPEYDINDFDSKRLVLEELIRQQLLVIDAQNRGLPNQKDIDAAVEEFKRTLIVREVANKIVEGIEVSESEAQEFYEQNKDIFIEPPQWHIREIVLDSQLKANEISVEVLKGADFAEMAKQHSIGESASNGGDLGIVQKASFPEMANAIVSLEEGEVSPVFKGPQGYYLIKAEEKLGGEPISFEEIKDEVISNRTMVKQQEAILNYIDQLKESIATEVNEELLK